LGDKSVINRSFNIADAVLDRTGRPKYNPNDVVCDV